MMSMGLCMFVISFLSIMFLSSTLLMILISMEFTILSLFILLIVFYFNESVLELISFMVIVVGESVLGLVLLILKVMMSGSDMISLVDVI